MGPIKVKKPKAILFDLSGTATKSYFTDKILFPYIKLNLPTYLHNNWDNVILQRDIQRLREQSKKDSGPVIASKDAPKEEIQKSIQEYVFECLKDLRYSDAINIFRLHMWFDGYQRDKIETPVYSDVAIQIKHWRITQQIKLFVLSNGWIEATKRFMAKTNHGDLNLLIDGHFDPTIGKLNNPQTFQKVCQKINLSPSEVLFLTKSPEEYKAAIDAKLNSILVLTHRRDLQRLSEQEKKDFTYVRSFNEIVFVDEHGGSSSSAASSAASGSSTSSIHSSKAISAQGVGASGASGASSGGGSSSSASSLKGSSSTSSTASSSKGGSSSSSASSLKGSSSASSSKGSSSSGGSSASSSKGSSSSGASSSKGSSSASSSRGSSSSGASSSKGSSSSGASSSRGSSSSGGSSSRGSSSSGASSSKGSSSSSLSSGSKGSSSRGGSSSSSSASSAKSSKK